MSQTTVEEISEIGVVSILTITSSGVKHRDTLRPGQFYRAKKVLPNEEYEKVISSWTPEIIATYEKEQDVAGL